MALEIERYYPYVMKLKQQIQSAIAGSDKNMHISVLRKAEAYMSAEVLKLKNKPNRATKYVSYMRRLISCMRLMLNLLTERDELEACSTLACIVCQYVNILLSSSMKSRLPPKQTASSCYSFLKMIFDRDVEFVLDVLICSNVADEGRHDQSIAFYMLSEALRDQHLYLQDAPTFTKFCTVAALLNGCKQGKEIVKEAIKDLTVHPSDLKNHLVTKYHFPKRIRFNVSSVIENIDSRLIASDARTNRLRVLPSKKRKPEQESEVGSSTENPKRSQSELFFYDVKGSYTAQEDHNMVTSTFQTINFEPGDEDAEREQVDNFELPSDEEVDQNLSEEKSSESESDHNIMDDLDLDVMDSQEEDAGSFEGEELGSITSRPFEEMYERREAAVLLNNFNSLPGGISYSRADGDDESIESLQDNEDKLQDPKDIEIHRMDVSLNQKHMDSEEDASSYSTVQNVVKTSLPVTTNEESDDDIEVIFENTTLPFENNEHDTEEERDLAEPESGEEEVPVYNDDELLRAKLMIESMSPYKTTAMEMIFEENQEEVSRESPTTVTAGSSSPPNEPLNSLQVEASQNEITEPSQPNKQNKMQTRKSVCDLLKEPVSPEKMVLKEIEEFIPINPSLEVSSSSPTKKSSIPMKTPGKRGRPPTNRGKLPVNKQSSPKENVKTGRLAKLEKEVTIPAAASKQAATAKLQLTRQCTVALELSITKEDETNGQPSPKRSRSSSKVESSPKEPLEDEGHQLTKGGKNASKAAVNQTEKAKKRQLTKDSGNEPRKSARLAGKK